MHKKNILTTLVLLWVLGVVAFLLNQQLGLADKLTGDGPIALSTAPDGGFYLATSQELFYFNEQEALVRRKTAPQLGLQELNALSPTPQGGLWIYDSAQRRPFLCNSFWRCEAFGPTHLALDRNVALSPGPNGQGLLLSDNSNHRLILLGPDGQLLDDGKNRPLHFPNQVSSSASGWLLADTDRFAILAIAPQSATALGAGSSRLKTERRPYRFVQREKEWWVVEAGVSLNEGELRHYRESLSGEPISRLLSSEATDLVAIADTGARLVLASRSDWRLLSLDPATGQSRPVAALEAEFAGLRQEYAQAKAQSKRLPWLMAGLLAPALLGGLVIQRMNPSTRVAAQTSGERVVRPQTHTAKVPITPLPAGHIKPEPQIWAELYPVNESAKRVLIAVTAVLLLMAISFFLLDLPPLLILLPAIAALLFPVLAISLRRLNQAATRRLIDQELICGPQKLVWKRQGKAVCAVPYKEVMLGGDTLVLGRHALPLYLKLPGQRLAIWPAFELQRELSARLQPEQMVHDDTQLLRALLRYRHPYALVLLLKFIGLPLLVIVILAAKLLKYDWLWQWFL